MGLIVNADDFGISHEVNMAILKSFEEGLINRTTLMVNMPYAEEAMQIAVENGFADKVGIHLNLTAGRPLSKKMAANRTMCDEHGEFTADFARNMKTRFCLDNVTTKCVEEEITCQLERYKELGGSLWHVDSHHHVHTDPSIWSALKKVMCKYPITSVRLGRNLYRGGNKLMRIYKVLLNHSISKVSNKHSGYFGSMDDYMKWTVAFDDNDSKSFITKYETEVMVHPMYNELGELTDSMEKFYKIM